MFEISRKSSYFILGISASTSALLLYWLYRTAQDEEEEVSERRKKPEVTSRQTVIEVPIPRKAVGGIIGRQGGVIKELQEKSGAKMNFKDDDSQAADGQRILVIRGSTETAQIAECMVLKYLADLPDTVEEKIFVPVHTLGRIIGKGGETVRQMGRSSNTKIFIDRTREEYRKEPRLITLVGTKANIEIAKTLIQEKIKEEDEFRAKAAVAASNRETRKVSAQIPHHATSIEQSNGEPVESYGQQMTFPKGKPFVEVYVSAIANPDNFWVQIIGSMALQLDTLSGQMNQFYEQEGQEGRLVSVKIGELVAAPFENDHGWYRARVMDINKDSEIDVFYVDYGDSAYLKLDQLRKLRSDFTTLPFQAIECQMEGIKPVGEDWTEEMFEKFEELSYCAKWKVVIAKPEQYVGNKPSIRLYDTSGSEDIDIGNQLVKLNLAKET